MNKMKKMMPDGQNETKKKIMSDERNKKKKH